MPHPPSTTLCWYKTLLPTHYTGVQLPCQVTPAKAGGVREEFPHAENILVCMYIPVKVQIIVPLHYKWKYL